MATTRTTISISDKAYALLKEFRAPNQSFSDVIEKYFDRGRTPADTCGELLDRLESLPPPEVDEKIAKTVRRGRGRRSPRAL
jgi:predicted CopG family antitoxin